MIFVIVFNICMAIHPPPLLPQPHPRRWLLLTSKCDYEDEMGCFGDIFSDSLPMEHVELRTFYPSRFHCSWVRQYQASRFIFPGTGNWTKLPRVCMWPWRSWVGSLGFEVSGPSWIQSAGWGKGVCVICHSTCKSQLMLHKIFGSCGVCS